ncbi:MAG: extracellular solute-binding protein [Candidatus Thiodiazotropha sp. (ex Monitilora ramsayi)]|nr:extracellular solute-binding protein [Candidatus Thiodiazotropha sp. (ex Monitilora ramsayi)]
MIRLCISLLVMLVIPQCSAADEPLVIYGSRQQALMEPLLQAYQASRDTAVRYVQDKSDTLLRRLDAEGEATPADLLLTADIGVLETAREMDLLQAKQSQLLSSLIPAKYRDPQGFWYGLSLRARMMLYAPGRIARFDLQDYADLSSSALKGRVCMRSLKHVYNQSLIAALVARWGEEKASLWLKGVVSNLARPPHGGDRDQIRAVAKGECDAAVVNSYYYAMMLDGDNEKDREIAVRVARVWPESGVHVNISGGGVTRHAPHPQLAIDFLEFLAGFDRQRLFAELNHEYPVVAGVPVSHTLMRLGAFEADFRPLALIARQRDTASRLIEDVSKAP